MSVEYITIKTYSVHYNIDPSFIILLEDAGLIELTIINGEKSVHTEQFVMLERYAHLHYDLNINIEGIDAIQHLVQKVISMQEEINTLKNQLNFHTIKE
ncbi:chaperone modulator CbpM [Flavobacterium sp. '19STA2R22 D10 B1']|uniref:chaperone modulator CbpM n=1 Tax=Flavobacterium aerium TaxID=3037261 RepID=UPI00278C39F2|nr:chaperone modulator CbpM [Flavobacterium sp. '19STA2R22 D10 B1']